MHVTVHAVGKGTPKRGVTVTIGSFSKVRFNVWIKNNKDSMSFEIMRGEGLGQNLTGILGQTLKGKLITLVYSYCVLLNLVSPH